MVGLVIIVTVIAQISDVGSRISELKGWILSYGVYAPVVFTVVYVLVVVMALPGWPMTVLAGSLFGSFLGVVLVSGTATLAASLCFLIARYFARDSIAQWIGENKKFKRLDQQVEKNGSLIVILTRVVPIFPFSLLNYAFGLTRVAFWPYVWWSFICMIPGTVMYVVGADAIVTAITHKRIPWALVVILFAIGIIISFAARTATRKLKEHHIPVDNGSEDS